MAVKEVAFYIAVCDRCGREAGENEYGEYSAMADRETAIDLTADADWTVLPENSPLGEQRRLLCFDCWTYDDNDEKVELPPETNVSLGG